MNVLARHKKFYLLYLCNNNNKLTVISHFPPFDAFSVTLQCVVNIGCLTGDISRAQPQVQAPGGRPSAAGSAATCIAPAATGAVGNEISRRLFHEVHTYTTVLRKLIYPNMSRDVILWPGQ